MVVIPALERPAPFRSEKDAPHLQAMPRPRREFQEPLILLETVGVVKEIIPAGLFSITVRPCREVMHLSIKQQCNIIQVSDNAA